MVTRLRTILAMGHRRTGLAQEKPEAAVYRLVAIGPQLASIAQRRSGVSTSSMSTAPTVEDLIVSLDRRGRMAEAERSQRAQRPVVWLPRPAPVVRMLLALVVMMLVSFAPLCLWLMWQVDRFSAALVERTQAEEHPPLPDIAVGDLADPERFAALVVRNPAHRPALCDLRIVGGLAKDPAAAIAEANALERSGGLLLSAQTHLALAEAELRLGKRDAALARLRRIDLQALEVGQRQQVIRLATIGLE